jgi:hypothetical protein
MGKVMYRTNSRTKGIFMVSTGRAGLIRPMRHQVPRETRHYARVAKELGMKSRFEVLPLSRLRSRGFVEHEDIEGSEARKQYIRDHINAIPYIVIRGRENDISDGNHRWVTFTEMGIKNVPCLRIMGTPAQFKKFEDFVQDYNKHPPWMKDAQFGKNPRTNPRTKNKFSRWYNPALTTKVGVSRSEALKKYGAVVGHEDE